MAEVLRHDHSHVRCYGQLNSTFALIAEPQDEQAPLTHCSAARTASSSSSEGVQATVILCGIGLFVLLLFLAYDLDLCPRFF